MSINDCQADGTYNPWVEKGCGHPGSCPARRGSIYTNCKEWNGSNGESLATDVETIVLYLFIYLFCAYPMFRTLLRQMLVVPVAVRSDNYAYLLIDQQSRRAAVVDPFDMQKVQAEAERIGVDVVGCLTTHHHHDHSGGNHVCRRSHVISRRADDVMGRPYRTLCVPSSQREPRWRTVVDPNLCSLSPRRPNTLVHPSTAAAKGLLR
jgi:hypothetical protein